MCSRSSNPPPPARADVELDHVGIGVPDVRAPLRTAVAELGATLLYGGLTTGCRYVVTRVGDSEVGMDLELLEPHATDEDPFLVRFLDRRGPGLHHVTFLVADLDAVLLRFADAGLEPVVRRDLPLWREAFFMPAQVSGVVMQLAQSDGPRSEEAFEDARAHEREGAASHGRRGWLPDSEPWWAWPGRRGDETAYFLRAALTCVDFDLVELVFGELLLGTVVERTEDRLELEWPRGGRLAFDLAPGARPGLHHLEIAELPAGLDQLGGAALHACAR